MCTDHKFKFTNCRHWLTYTAPCETMKTKTADAGVGELGHYECPFADRVVVEVTKYQCCDNRCCERIFVNDLKRHDVRTRYPTPSEELNEGPSSDMASCLARKHQLCTLDEYGYADVLDERIGFVLRTSEKGDTTLRDVEVVGL